MLLDYSKIEFDHFGRPEAPELMLQTMDRSPIGLLTNVSELTFDIKFSEQSQISFVISRYSDGVETPFYDDVTGYKLIYTKNYGIYIIMKPTVTGDGIKEEKTVQGYSLEAELDMKRFFLEEGTFNFWNPASPTDTIIGRALELAPGWKAGYVSPALIGRYRTFDQYDDGLLSFLYNSVPDKFRCVFAFDPYEMTINAYDGDEDMGALPIYLDFDNLLTQVDVDELTEELVTAMRPYGADDLDIRNVNPIGTNWIYDLTYFVENGDIPADLAKKWNAWQAEIRANQELYKGLTGLRASSTATLLAEQAKLTDLEGELKDLTNQQSVTIQALAEEITDDGKKSTQAKLDEINKNIEAKKAEIEAKKAEIEETKKKTDPEVEGSYAAQIVAITKELAITSYFTPEEYQSLSRYFIEQDMTESTFVASDLKQEITGSLTSIAEGGVSIKSSKIDKVVFPKEAAKNMYLLSGGTFSVKSGEDEKLSGDVIRGTLEEEPNGSFILSIYAGTLTAGETTAPSGMLTITGSLSGLTSDIHEVTDQEVTTLEGTKVAFSIKDCSVYLTANISDYQRYSVAMELYDFAKDKLSDLAMPAYEFTVDSGNFLFAKEFAPFRNKLRLGSSVYLRLRDDYVITPIAIEIQLDFEDRSKFSLVFSNRFKRHDNVNTLKDMIEKSYSSSRSFDASKYTYNQVSNQAAKVSEFMRSGLDAAVNTITGADNQSVRIDGAGIHIGGSSKDQIRIVNSMIAFSDDDWATAKLAIGRFATKDGSYFGVNAEVIGGKLIAGNNLIIENENNDGVMQFKVDSTGAWLNNSTFILQSEYTSPLDNGKIIIDPKYGIVAGSKDLYKVDGTTVTPSFIDSDGKITEDDDGFPENANFYLDIRNGNAYFRGRVNAKEGSIGGWDLAEDSLHSGSGKTHVELNSSKANNSLYAIWAGADNPENAPFWVKRDGSMKANNGDFSGTLNAPRLKGPLVSGDTQYIPDANESGGWLIGCGIKVGPYTEGESTKYRFLVDQNGNVQMTGSITWDSSSSPVAVLYGRAAYSTPTQKYATYPDTSSSGWHRLFTSVDLYASYTYDGGETWTAAVKVRGEDGSDADIPGYIKRNYIGETTILSPNIVGGVFYATGLGDFNDPANNPAYYFCQGIEGSGANAVPLETHGYICYDSNGDPDESGYTAARRVILRTDSLTAIKLEAGDNMSLQANEFIYVHTPFQLSPEHYGTSLPNTSRVGQLFFKLE